MEIRKNELQRGIFLFFLIFILAALGGIYLGITFGYSTSDFTLSAVHPARDRIVSAEFFHVFLTFADMYLAIMLVIMLFGFSSASFWVSFFLILITGMTLGHSAYYLFLPENFGVTPLSKTPSVLIAVLFLICGFAVSFFAASAAVFSKILMQRQYAKQSDEMLENQPLFSKGWLMKKYFLEFLKISGMFSFAALLVTAVICFLY